MSENKDNSLPLVVTANTVASVLNRPEAVEGIAKATAQNQDPMQAAMTIAFMGRVRSAIDKAQGRVGGDVMAVPSSEDEDAVPACILMSLLAEGNGQDKKGTTTPGRDLPQGKEAKFDTNDWAGWASVAIEKMRHIKKHPGRPSPVVIQPFPNQGRVAMLGDWGTGLYGAPRCAAQITRDPGSFAMLLHLGDIYYSGSSTEVKSRFIDAWPKRSDPGLIHRATNGNHEMYAGGDAYFNDILPLFEQESSYFAHANDHWLLIGLDTAHTDHGMDERQVNWLNQILALPEARNKKVIFFSHHQLFSKLESQGRALASDDCLGKLLREGRVTAWYWGHEHRCSIYDPHPGYGGLLARCVGHSGMPETRSKVRGWSVERTVETPQDPVLWRRFDAETKTKLFGKEPIDVPSGIVLDGRNRYMVDEAQKPSGIGSWFSTDENEKFAPHGYATLEFNGGDLVERVHTPDGFEIHQMKVG